MNGCRYVSLMKKRLTAAFDITVPPNDELATCDLWAVHNRSSQKYFLSRSIELYTVNNDEYVGLRVFAEKINEADMLAFLDQFKRLISAHQADEKHMSSIYTAALISEKAVNPALVNKLKKIRHHKDYWFTLRGWADLAVILVDLPNRKIYSNPFGRKVVNNYVFPDENV